jgi:hypothetical protein
MHESLDGRVEPGHEEEKSICKEVSNVMAGLVPAVQVFAA